MRALCFAWILIFLISFFIFGKLKIQGPRRYRFHLVFRGKTSHDSDCEMLITCTQGELLNEKNGWRLNILLSAEAGPNNRGRFLWCFFFCLRRVFRKSENSNRESSNSQQESCEILVLSRKPPLNKVSKTLQSIIDFLKKMKMGQTVFCLFCVLSLSFEKLPGRKIKEKKKSFSVCGTTSEDKCAGSKDRTQCILLFLFFLLCNIMFSAGRCKRLNWLCMFKYRVSQRKTKNLHKCFNTQIYSAILRLIHVTFDLDNNKRGSQWWQLAFMCPANYCWGLLPRRMLMLHSWV